MLELGCGLALPSVAAARAGANVLATDGSPDAVAFAAHTLALDEQVGDVAAIDWREPRLLLEQGPWDLVLAADVLYLQANVRILLDLLPKLVAPGGQVWIADPGRDGGGGAARPRPRPLDRGVDAVDPQRGGGDPPPDAQGDVMSSSVAAVAAAASAARSGSTLPASSHARW